MEPRRTSKYQQWRGYRSPKPPQTAHPSSARLTAARAGADDTAAAAPKCHTNTVDFRKFKILAVAARGVGPPKRKSIQNCNILQVLGTMQKCNSLIFVGLVRAPLAPQKFCIICYNFTLWEGLFFGGPWVCATAKKMRNLQFQNVGYSYSMTKPLKHKFDSK